MQAKKAKQAWIHSYAAFSNSTPDSSRNAPFNFSVKFWKGHKILSAPSSEERGGGPDSMMAAEEVPMSVLQSGEFGNMNERVGPKVRP